MTQKVLYRIYTEAVNLDGIYNAVGFYFEGATVYTGRGFYGEKSEDCVIIEIVNDGGLTAHNQVIRFADAVKRTNNQECVLITCQAIESELR